MFFGKKPDCEVLCSVTSASTHGDKPMDWRMAIRVAPRLGLRRVGLFLTGLGPEERQECYGLFRRYAPRVTVPFVHARNDMRPDEYRLLMEDFGTELFNLHRTKDKPLRYGLPPEIKSRICIENAWYLEDDDMDGFSGVCLDLSHLEAVRNDKVEDYDNLMRLLNRHPIRANHVSAFVKAYVGTAVRPDRHTYVSLEDFDYLREYHTSLYGKYVAIKLCNPLSEQLKVKDYLEKVLRRAPLARPA